MKGISKAAQFNLDVLIDEFHLRECDLISLIIEGLSINHMVSLVRERTHPNAPKLRPAKYERRIETGSMRVRQSKYGFADMTLGQRHKVVCDSHTSRDYPIQAARRYALRMGYDFWYQRVVGERAVLVCFTKKA